MPREIKNPRRSPSYLCVGKASQLMVVVVVSGRADLNLPHFRRHQPIVRRFWRRLAFDVFQCACQTADLNIEILGLE